MIMRSQTGICRRRPVAGIVHAKRNGTSVGASARSPSFKRLSAGKTLAYASQVGSGAALVEYTARSATNTPTASNGVARRAVGAMRASVASLGPPCKRGRMDYEQIRYEVDGPILTITLNRPDK